MQMSDLRPSSEFARKFGVKSVLYGKPGSGKCLGKGTPVIMYDGTTKLVEDVIVGDLLMGPDSLPRAVTSLARGREEMFRITPNHGDAFTCNRSHLLSLALTHTKNRHGNPVLSLLGKSLDSRYGRPTVVVSVDELLSAGKGIRHNLKLWRVPVEHASRPCPIDPYLLGLWLGDGDSDCMRITTVDNETVQYLATFCADNGYKLVPRKYHSTPAYSITRDTNPKAMGTILRECNLLNNKHIPDWILCNSRAVRMACLAGLLDSDGYLNTSGHGYEISQTNIHLGLGIERLARSLGFRCTGQFNETTATNGAVGNVCVAYRMQISGPVEELPVRLPRKISRPRSKWKDHLVTGFIVESLGQGDYYGFELTGDKLFLLGDYTVTHNTPIAATTSPKPVLLLCEPGALTLRNVNVPAWEAFTPERVAEFFKWLKESNERKNFQTVVVDSGSQIMEIYLDKYLGKNTKAGNKAHGQQAYGEAARETMEHLNDLYFMKEMHCVIICKRAVVTDQGVEYARPIFAGKDLNARVPHLFDLIMQLGVFPGSGVQFPVMQCHEQFDSMARDRSGMLAPYETANLGAIFAKCMTAVPAQSAA